MGDWALPEEKPVLLARVVPSISNSIGAGLRLLWEEYTGPWSLEDMSLHRAPKQNKQTTFGPQEYITKRTKLKFYLKDVTWNILQESTFHFPTL